MDVLTRRQVRDLDRTAIERFGIPGIVLMENAGRGATRFLLRELNSAEARIGIVCGKGNNGGDGFVIARHLALTHRSGEVILLGEPGAFRRPGDAGTNFEIVEKMGLRITPASRLTDLEQAFARFDIVVDAILGTGLEGEVRGLARDAIEALNDSRPGQVFAVDTPSGLDCDTGAPLGVAVRADSTATFAAMKRGFLQPHAREYTGKVEVVGIGCPGSGPTES